jgi:hypothetical protein
MSFSYTVHPSLNLVFMRLNGEMNYLQEVEAVSSVLTDERISRDVRILIDRNKAPLKTNPERINQFIEVLIGSLEQLGRPRIALLVNDAIDYGLTRLLELQAGSINSHDIRVFYEIDHALAWLGIDIESFAEISK